MQLLKSQIFAIRGEEWLHSICPIPKRIELNTLVELIADDLKREDRRSWWDQTFNPRPTNYYRSLAYQTERFKEEYSYHKSHKKAEWKDTRKEWELVAVNMAGSFSDHLIIIKHIESQKSYECLCNNYGGNNHWIELKEI